MSGPNLPEGTKVLLLADVPALTLYDRADEWSTEVPAGTVGEIVQAVAIRRDGAVIWKASDANRTRDQVGGVDAYEVYFDADREEDWRWVYAPADIVLVAP